MTSTPLKHSSTPSSSDGVASLSKPRDLHLPTSESATREQSFIGHFQIGRIDIEGISPSAHSACPRNDASSALSRLPGEYQLAALLNRLVMEVFGPLVWVVTVRAPLPCPWTMLFWFSYDSWLIISTLPTQRMSWRLRPWWINQSQSLWRRRLQQTHTDFSHLYLRRGLLRTPFTSTRLHPRHLQSSSQSSLFPAVSPSRAFFKLRPYLHSCNLVRCLNRSYPQTGAEFLEVFRPNLRLRQMRLPKC